MKSPFIAGPYQFQSGVIGRQAGERDFRLYCPRCGWEKQLEFHSPAIADARAHLCPRSAS